MRIYFSSLFSNTIITPKFGVPIALTSLYPLSYCSFATRSISSVRFSAFLVVFIKRVLYILTPVQISKNGLANFNHFFNVKILSNNFNLSYFCILFNHFCILSQLKIKNIFSKSCLPQNVFFARILLKKN